MNANEILKQKEKELAEEENKTFRDAFVKTKRLDAAVESVRTLRKSRVQRGGARPGAGRKAGSGTGRKDAARLEFNVSEEFKTAFERRAASEGVSKVELLRRLFLRQK